MACAAGSLSPTSVEFYRSILYGLRESQIPFLVGGAFALRNYTGIVRDTKDLDVFLLPGDVAGALKELEARGFRAEVKYPHWLAKVHREEYVVDLIFNSGNGLCEVDKGWFQHAREGLVLGESVKLVPREEVIWQKAFIMERHRFDGADVINLIHHHAESLDWERLITRFGEHYPVLLAHLILHRFVYPHYESPKLAEVTRRLWQRQESALRGQDQAGGAAPLCRGTFLSLLEYLPAISHWGYQDARLPPTGTMTPAEILHWTSTMER